MATSDVDPSTYVTGTRWIAWHVLVSVDLTDSNFNVAEIIMQLSDLSKNKRKSLMKATILVAFFFFILYNKGTNIKRYYYYENWTWI